MKRILVVDDDAASCEEATAILQELGSAVETMADGDTALERLQAGGTRCSVGGLSTTMTAQVDVRPRIVAVSSESAFLHLIQSLLDSLGLAVRTTSDWDSAIRLVERIRPQLVILDLLPGREDLCWLALETIKARRATQSIPVLVCPVAGWLLAGREQLLGLRGVYVWPEGFELEDLLGSVQLALAT
jgi:CheY-like chemotaxis protein